MIATPATWTDALAWLTVYTDRYVDLLLVGDGGGLAIEGPTYFAGVQQRDGDTFGLELAGLTYWFAEDQVGGVGIYQDTDSLIFHVEGQATISLTPRLEP